MKIETAEKLQKKFKAGLQIFGETYKWELLWMKKENELWNKRGKNSIDLNEVEEEYAN